MSSPVKEMPEVHHGIHGLPPKPPRPITPAISAHPDNLARAPLAPSMLAPPPPVRMESAAAECVGDLTITVLPRGAPVGTDSPASVSNHAAPRPTLDRPDEITASGSTQVDGASGHHSVDRTFAMVTIPLPGEQAPAPVSRLDGIYHQRSPHGGRPMSISPDPSDQYPFRSATDGYFDRFTTLDGNQFNHAAPGHHQQPIKEEQGARSGPRPIPTVDDTRTPTPGDSANYLGADGNHEPSEYTPDHTFDQYDSGNYAPSGPGMSSRGAYSGDAHHGNPAYGYVPGLAQYGGNNGGRDWSTHANGQPGPSPYPPNNHGMMNGGAPRPSPGHRPQGPSQDPRYAANYGQPGGYGSHRVPQPVGRVDEYGRSVSSLGPGPGHVGHGRIPGPRHGLRLSQVPAHGGNMPSYGPVPTHGSGLVQNQHRRPMHASEWNLNKYQLGPPDPGMQGHGIPYYGNQYMNGQGGQGSYAPQDHYGNTTPPYLRPLVPRPGDKYYTCEVDPHATPKSKTSTPVNDQYVSGGRNPGSSKHNAWLAIFTHTAKCDGCQNHNTSVFQRCNRCNKQYCQPCFVTGKADTSNHIVDLDSFVWDDKKALTEKGKEAKGKKRVATTPASKQPAAKKGKKGSKGASLGDDSGGDPDWDPSATRWGLPPPRRNAAKAAGAATKKIVDDYENYEFGDEYAAPTSKNTKVAATSKASKEMPYGGYNEIDAPHELDEQYSAEADINENGGPYVYGHESHWTEMTQEQANAMKSNAVDSSISALNPAAASMPSFAPVVNAPLPAASAGRDFSNHLAELMAKRKKEKVLKAEDSRIQQAARMSARDKFREEVLAAWKTDIGILSYIEGGDIEGAMEVLHAAAVLIAINSGVSYDGKELREYIAGLPL
jgi:hypothetical protein